MITQSGVFNDRKYFCGLDQAGDMSSHARLSKAAMSRLEAMRRTTSNLSRGFTSGQESTVNSVYNSHTYTE
jgi:hypothetical protein